MPESFRITLWAPDKSSNGSGCTAEFSAEKEKEAQAIHILEVMESEYNSELDRYEFPSKGDLFLAAEKLLALIYLV